MKRALCRAVRLVLSPNEEWRRIKTEEPRTLPLFLEFVLPLSCIPALAWALGLALSGEHAEFGRDAAALGVPRLASRAALAFSGFGLSIALLGIALCLLAPLFGKGRDLPRALQVAAYCSSPVLLGGVVLAVPGLAFALTIAAIHSLYLLYGGVHFVLGVKAGDAAEYVALVVVLSTASSTLAGAALSSLGVM